MDLRHLRYFIAAVETGAIARAAERCHIAQPSVSQAIQRLEEELGTRLLFRQRDGVHPTAEGQRLYQDARRLLQDAERLKQRIRAPQAGERLSVRIPRTIGGHRLPALLHRLQSVLPGVHWSLVHEEAPATLSLQSWRDTPAAMAFLPLWTETYHLLLPSNQFWPDNDEDRLTLLNRLPLVERLYCEQRPVFEQWLAARQVQFRVLASVSSEDQAQALVAEGLGWAVAPLLPGESLPGIRAVSLARLTGAATVPERRLGLAVDPVWLQGVLGQQLQAAWGSIVPRASQEKTE